jgi:hypothetical protein
MFDIASKLKSNDRKTLPIFGDVFYVKALSGSEIDLGAKEMPSGQTVIEANGQNSKVTANNLENIAGRPSLYAKNGAILQLPALNRRALPEKGRVKAWDLQTYIAM